MSRGGVRAPFFGVCQRWLERYCCGAEASATGEYAVIMAERWDRDQNASPTNTLESKTGHGHFFTKKTFHKPTYCHHCTDILWGLIGQGYVCEGKVDFHVLRPTHLPRSLMLMLMMLWLLLLLAASISLPSLYIAQPFDTFANIISTFSSTRLCYSPSLPLSLFPISPTATFGSS